jgi:hypothetical protein
MNNTGTKKVDLKKPFQFLNDKIFINSSSPTLLLLATDSSINSQKCYFQLKHTQDRMKRKKNETKN